MIEFLGLAVLLGVPLVYLVVAIAQFQAAALASVTISEQLAKLQAQSGGEPMGSRLEAATREMAQAAGVKRSAVGVELTCSPTCETAGALISVTVKVSVSPPFLPDGVGSVSAQAAARSPRFG